MYITYSVKSESGYLKLSSGDGEITFPLEKIVSIKEGSNCINICVDTDIGIFTYQYRVVCSYEDVLEIYRNACKENNVVTPFFGRIESERVMRDIDNMIPEAGDVGLSKCGRFFTFCGTRYLRASTVMSFDRLPETTLVRLADGRDQIWHIKFEDFCDLINQSKG